ncbi:unnamed protein product [Rotaria socialis]|uniref:EF-hand domain-containing protein n=2 Tax=Rotaria socialis TaxID=392032 RepID=A0A819W8B2_9BILA|nr:unnamed protein product [Rotaria socialis]CAF4118833.1 unnamed protein product [Rotaria socialis]
MLVLNLNITMEALDLAVDDDLLEVRTSRTVTFTLSSSNSSLSLCSQHDHQTHERTVKMSCASQISEHRHLAHSQSLTLECQRHRPIIQDPYQLAPDLQVLDDWMITTTGKTRRQLSEVHGVSEEQIVVYEESFSLLDKDGDGNISNYEIRSLMSSLGYSTSLEDISSVISKIDVDGDGTVDFNEFLTIMRQGGSKGESDIELRQIFDIFDKKTDGFIDKDELYDLLVKLGEHITDEDVIEMIEEADCFDNDGKVSYEEFKAILHSK